MKKTRSSIKTLLMFALVGAVTGWRGQDRPAASCQAPDSELRRAARRGLDLLMDGDPDAAIEIFRQIQQKDPQSPLGFVMEADATWWKIYYSTANLIDPDVFAATDSPTSPYDAHFEDLVRLTVRKAEANIRAKKDVARSYLYEGFAYGLRARLAGLRDKDLPTARAGKKMRSLLLTALKLDPNLFDTYLGIGLYNYFEDTLSAIVKILAWIIRLPGGSRLEGLRQLQLCAEKGELARAEAEFYLAKDYSRPNEKQYAKSILLFEEMAREYPHNPLWKMLIGSLQYRIGQPQQGEAIYREVFQQTARKDSFADQAVHGAVRHALERNHPNEKFDQAEK